MVFRLYTTVKGQIRCDKYKSIDDLALAYEGVRGRYQKATRGPERNYCVSFGWMSKNRQRAMQGTYCKVLPVGETITAEAMLTTLGLRFR